MSASSVDFWVLWFNDLLVIRDVILGDINNRIHDVVKDVVDKLKTQQPRDKYTALNLSNVNTMVYIESLCVI